MCSLHSSSSTAPVADSLLGLIRQPGFGSRPGFDPGQDGVVPGVSLKPGRTRSVIIPGQDSFQQTVRQDMFDSGQISSDIISTVLTP